MLYADKRALETNLQVSLLKIREKELQFYTQNCIAIGTQAALLSGFAYNGIIQVDIPSEAADWLKTLVSCHPLKHTLITYPRPSALRRLLPLLCRCRRPSPFPCVVPVRDDRRHGLRADRCPEQVRHSQAIPADSRCPRLSLWLRPSCAD